MTGTRRLSRRSISTRELPTLRRARLEQRDGPCRAERLAAARREQRRRTAVQDRLCGGHGDHRSVSTSARLTRRATFPSRPARRGRRASASWTLTRPLKRRRNSGGTKQADLARRWPRDRPPATRIVTCLTPSRSSSSRPSPDRVVPRARVPRGGDRQRRHSITMVAVPPRVDELCERLAGEREAKRLADRRPTSSIATRGVGRPQHDAVSGTSTRREARAVQQRDRAPRATSRASRWPPSRPSTTKTPPVTQRRSGARALAAPQPPGERRRRERVHRCPRARAITTNSTPNTATCAATEPRSGSTNCGRKARKNSAVFGLSTFTTAPCTNSRRGDAGRRLDLGLLGVLVPRRAGGGRRSRSGRRRRRASRRERGRRRGEQRREPDHRRGHVDEPARGDRRAPRRGRRVRPLSTLCVTM